ncbi:similar to Saccharomyces cerevisiae YOR005C DNL4 DNA ligase required for nonhomologous end- joining (NHEJ), forms stable heterodimer with required cofactor Lif1p, interacts with Nej1p [Maudiozyma barnettii]|uniref:DNA ligase n=1 Tax=Maudiozyma barnettii TaxID=61262 RepID=A0A8H2VI62_9SACH|nr:DNA ligase (ATP) DNL4 [Kazachstania barnettii]CAB4255876.1 similar to Saccharomyces cerevisiae YOR005C DNL4 DNA ligase required for nonhomologous end- joining (NHEJ), forms stable heterodimer with required cofactor Lif1p, interacts with Nej1p [Kazachstania barnettii]CAD1784436.1 similar to Saccharomyces cerevisiae YOR005C DNL4 DNA ligase required for nonhomologous end- joining (NHEJ), forms stable heterodimer with required cofactor Lif1p, interacts with Nej1p [Kazachstania barnettii]
MNLKNNEAGEEPKNISISPDFLWLCQELFVKIDEISKNNTKNLSKPIYILYYEIIERFINLWRNTVGNDIYPALRLILPYRDRTIFNIKEITLAKALCLWLKLPGNSITEKKLLHWKEYASRGDKLSNICVGEISKRRSEYTQISENKKFTRPSRISIDDLNSKLDQLSLERNSKDRGYKSLANSEVFQYCMHNMSFIEMKYFFDILLKNRVIGGQEHKFLNCWHPDARDYLSVVSDLRVLTKRLWDPKVRLEQDDLAIRIGYAFSPQLAKKVNSSYATVSKKLSNNFLIEEKMDGERIQMHYKNYGTEIKFLSRRGTDFTYLYGSDLDSDTVAKYLKLDINVKNCILDGEMVTFDKGRGIVLPFGIVKGSAKDVLTQNDVSSEGFSPMYVVFDLLFINDTPLTESPLHQRKDYLTKILTEVPHHIEIINTVKCDNEELIKSSLEKAIYLGSEGIVLKAYNSKYSVGSRNDSWIKVKPEYLEQFGENMDLIVMGRDSGKKDSLICGLIEYKNDDKLKSLHIIEVTSADENDTDQTIGNKPKELKCVMSFCTIANGLSQEEFKEISRKTRGKWNRSEVTPPPTELLFGTKIPVEWIDPRNSVVLEIKARSLDNTSTKSHRYKVGCTIFGGYCRQVRYDKNWRDCYTYSSFQDDRISKQNQYKRTNHHQLVSPKKRKQTKNYGILSSFQNRTVDIIKKTDIFTNNSFYVMTDYINEYDNKRTSKEDIIDMVIENGGKIVYNILLKEWDYKYLRIIGNLYTNECKTLSKRGYDIISAKWILDSINNNRAIKLEPDHCFDVSEELSDLANLRVDKFKDSYTSILDDSSVLKCIEDNMDSVQDADNYELYYSIPQFLFYKRVIFVVHDATYNPHVYELQTKIRLFGGETTDDLDACNLVVIGIGYSIDITKEVRNIRYSISKRVHATSHTPLIPYIVNSNWIQNSIERNVQLPEEDFPYIAT